MSRDKSAPTATGYAAEPVIKPAKDPAAASPQPGKPSLLKTLSAVFSSTETDERATVMCRRRFVIAAVLGTLGVNFLMFLRFFFPRVLYEPKTKFKIGYPSDFGFGVDSKFQSQHRIWVVRNTEGRSEEHTSELQSLRHLVCRLLLENKK